MADQAMQVGRLQARNHTILTKVRITRKHSPSLPDTNRIRYRYTARGSCRCSGVTRLGPRP